MTKRHQDGIRLRVARAWPGDEGEATARMSAGALRALALPEGSVVEIVGRQRTAAIARALDRGGRVSLPGSAEVLRLILLDRALVAGDCVATSAYRLGVAGAAEDLRRV